MIKSIKKIIDENYTDELENEIIFDQLYVVESHRLIIDSLKQGCDVVQLPTGDILVTKMKPVTTQYVWDPTKKKLARASSSFI